MCAQQFYGNCVLVCESMFNGSTEVGVEEITCDAGAEKMSMLVSVLVCGGWCQVLWCACVYVYGMWVMGAGRGRRKDERANFG